MKALFLIPLLAGACVDMGDRGPGIVGTSADVQTEPGDYAGFRVASPCDSTNVNLGVIGTGSVVLTDSTDLHALVDELWPLLPDTATVWGGRSGTGIACEAGAGVTFSTNDWRVIDPMITRIGDYLRDHDYAVQVGISVGSIPVAQ
jgi:hypothetical protein